MANAHRQPPANSVPPEHQDDDWLKALKHIVSHDIAKEEAQQSISDLLSQAIKLRAIGCITVCSVANHAYTSVISEDACSIVINSKGSANGWGRELSMWRSRVSVASVDDIVEFVEPETKVCGGKTRPAISKTKVPPVLSSSVRKDSKDKNDSSATNKPWGSKELLEKSRSTESSSTPEATLSPKGPGFT
jgi:hypothetical protein